MLIIVNYSYMTETGVSYEDVRILIPLSNLWEAKALVDKLNKNNI